MSQENVRVRNDVIRRCFWAFENDTAAFRDSLHPEIEWFQATMRGEASGVSVTQGLAVLYTLHTNGKIIREQRYTDHAEALEAVGLSE